MNLDEEIYSYWRKNLVFLKTGSYPRAIVNWDIVKEKPEWVYISRFIDLYNRLNGQLNWKIYLDALFDFYGKNGFPLKILGTQKSIAIYNNYIKDKNEICEAEFAYKSIIRSLKHIILYCKKNKLKSFEEYFYENNILFPTILKDYIAGNISLQFLCIIPNIENKIKNFPKDIYLDMFSQEKLNELFYIREKIFESKKIRTVSQIFESIINKEINV